MANPLEMYERVPSKRAPQRDTPQVLAIRKQFRSDAEKVGLSGKLLRGVSRTSE